MSGPSDFYKPGSFNRICDRTGFKIKAGRTKREWNNLIVRTPSWERRHPQDFLRAFPDHQQVENARTDQESLFVGTNEVTTTDFTAGGTPGTVAISTWDAGLSWWDEEGGGTRIYWDAKAQ